MKQSHSNRCGKMHNARASFIVRRVGIRRIARDGCIDIFGRVCQRVSERETCTRPPLQRWTTRNFGRLPKKRLLPLLLPREPCPRALVPSKGFAAPARAFVIVTGRAVPFVCHTRGELGGGYVHRVLAEDRGQVLPCIASRWDGGLGCTVAHTKRTEQTTALPSNN